MNREKKESEDRLKIRLLADLARIWPTGEQKASTKNLIARLVALKGSPWAQGFPLTPKMLSTMLAGFAIWPCMMRVLGRCRRGYTFYSLRQAWERHLPADRNGSVTE